MKCIIETKRLLFRETIDSDFESLKRILSDKEEVSDEYVLRWLNWCKSSYEKDKFGLWSVILKENGEMIGSCGLSMQLIDGVWRPEVGYHLDKRCHRLGLGKEAAVAIRDYFFTHYEYDEVYSYMDINNIPSIKTAEANGMKYIKTFITKDNKECRIYRITRKEWEEIK